MKIKKRKKVKSKSRGMRISDALQSAIQQHRKGKLDAAQKAYKRILDAVPDQPDAMHFLGVLSHQRGHSDKAIALIQRAIDTQPDYMDACNNLGNVFKDLDRLDDAARSYRRVIELRPDSPLGYSNLGTVFTQKKEYDEAVALYKKAIALSPEFADAYHNLGNALKKQGNIEEALSAYFKAISLQAGHADAYKSLGRALYAAGRNSEAGQVYKQWLKQDPGSPIARHMLAACTGEDVPERASDDFVAQTFDRFSGSFDTVLKRLEYRAPVLVAEAIGEALGVQNGGVDILDAGCGTGLCGSYLKPYARKLAGVDLSSGMLEKASGLNLYDELVKSELTEYLDEHPENYDLIASADTLCYFGSLNTVFSSAAASLRSGGRIVFTLEHAGEENIPEGFSINPHGRYSHSEDYVRRMLGDAGFSVDCIKVEKLRREGETSVAGLVVTGRKCLKTDGYVA